MACSKEAMLRSDGGRQCAATRIVVAQSRNGRQARLAGGGRGGDRDWNPDAANPAWDGLELSLRTGVSEALLGQKDRKAGIG